MFNGQSLMTEVDAYTIYVEGREDSIGWQLKINGAKPKIGPLLTLLRTSFPRHYLQALSAIDETLDGYFQRAGRTKTTVAVASSALKGVEARLEDSPRARLSDLSFYFRQDLRAARKSSKTSKR